MKRIASLALVAFGVWMAGSAGEAAAQQAGGLGFYGVGGRLSFVKAENVSSTLGIGGHADLGEIVPNLVLYPSIAYWKRSENEAGGDRFRSSFSEFTINADVHYYFPSEGSFDFYAGGGLALVFWKSTARFPMGDFGTVSSSVSDSDVGVNLLGGVETALSPTLTGFAQARYKIDGADTFKITVGLTVAVGAHGSAGGP